jgi:hypothetical protein
MRMAEEGEMRLLVAWFVSALAGAAIYPVGLCIALWLLGGPPGGWPLLPLAMSMLRMIPPTFVICLAVQLIYGGILYALLGRLGWFNLPLLLLAYIVPAVYLAMSSDVPKDAIMGIPRLTSGIALAGVGWLLARAQTDTARK